MSVIPMPTAPARHYLYCLTARHADQPLFTVGYYTASGDWVPHAHVAGLHATQCMAARLNGLPQPPPPRRCDKTLDMFTTSHRLDKVRVQFEQECG